jgi:hypothetical protein
MCGIDPSSQGSFEFASGGRVVMPEIDPSFPILLRWMLPWE